MSNEIIRGLGFHHIALKVKDFEKSSKFYEALGFKMITGWGKPEETLARMYDIGDGAILELFSGGGDHLSEKGKWLHLALCTDDVEAAYETALSAGATSISAPRIAELDSAPEKMTIHFAFVRGLDGEELEFFKKL